MCVINSCPPTEMRVCIWSSSGLTSSHPFAIQSSIVTLQTPTVASDKTFWLRSATSPVMVENGDTVQFSQAASTPVACKSRQSAASRRFSYSRIRSINQGDFPQCFSLGATLKENKHNFLFCLGSILLSLWTLTKGKTFRRILLTRLFLNANVESYEKICNWFGFKPFLRWF